MVDGALARRFGGYRDRSVDDNVVGAVVVVGVDRGTEHTHLTGFESVRDDLFINDEVPATDR